MTDALIKELENQIDAHRSNIEFWEKAKATAESTKDWDRRNHSDREIDHNRRHMERYTKCLDALRRPVEPVVTDQWQPIETAPKDGTWFLGFEPGRSEQDAFDVWRWYNRWPKDDLFINAADSNEEWQQPTHWKPLPAAPITQPAGEG